MSLAQLMGVLRSPMQKRKPASPLHLVPAYQVDLLHDTLAALPCCARRMGTHAAKRGQATNIRSRNPEMLLVRSRG